MKTIAFYWLLVWTASAGEISERYWEERKGDTNLLQRMANHKSQQMSLRALWLTNGSGQVEIAFGNVTTNHGITEIGLERTGCYGTCPAYTFVITGDGKCRYEGRKHARIQGTKTGLVSLVEFHRIATLLKEIEFERLENEYEAMVTDNATVFTTAVIGGKRKTIRNYAEAGPSRLWALEQVLDSTLTRVRWNN